MGLKKQVLTMMNDDIPKTFWLDPEDIEAINSSLINNRDYMDSSDTQGTIKSILLEIGTYEARVTQNPTAVKMIQNVHFSSTDRSKMPVYLTDKEALYIVDNVSLPIDGKEVLER